MGSRKQRRLPWHLTKCAALGALATLLGCGGGGSTGNVSDSGTSKTYLSVQVADVDGDSLSYQWRATAGTIENRNSKEAVWTMPDGPGLHFAYVTVSDGKGGYVVQQYAASTDSLGTNASALPPTAYAAKAVTASEGSTFRLRFALDFAGTPFALPSGNGTARRLIYMPDVSVQVVAKDGPDAGTVHFSGITNSIGDVNVPPLKQGISYQVKCSTPQASVLIPCGPDLSRRDEDFANLVRVEIKSTLSGDRNLRLFGNISFADQGTCSSDNEYFGLAVAATVQLLQADGTSLTVPARVNRFGDYALDAAVPVKGSLALKIVCETYTKTLNIPASAGTEGYVSDRPIELSHQIPNSRPSIVKMVGYGPDGNVRGRMVEPLPGDSNLLPGTEFFLAYKGGDTRRGACAYYRSLGAVKECDAQGNPIGAITLDDWKRSHKFSPYKGSNAEIAANYINRMDLNLVRRMTATKTSDQNIAFYVCNHPGPEGDVQREVDNAFDVALSDKNLVACVAMEWSASPGVNGGKPFTKFFTFGPDGTLFLAVDLDGRGQKHMPGACVACHGGTKYNGRFSETGNQSPNLGSSFLAFDTGNYLFSSQGNLTEQAQSESIWGLNQLVLATDDNVDTSNSRLIKGWYGSGQVLNKSFVPNKWLTHPEPGAAQLYREIIGPACRTCHAAMGATQSRFDFDLNPDAVIKNQTAEGHFCGGTADLATNAVMPNALVSRDRVSERLRSNPSLTAVTQALLGCDTPRADPVYPKR